MKFAAATLLLAGVAVAKPTAPHGQYTATIIRRATSNTPTTVEVSDVRQLPIVQGYLAGAGSSDSQNDAGDMADKFRIVNGVQSTTDYPWMASINIISSLKADGTAKIAMCGGSLINENYVLTAAHCFHEENGPNWLKPEELNVGPGPQDTMPNIILQLGGNVQQFEVSNGMMAVPDNMPYQAPEDLYDYRSVVEVDCYPGYNGAEQANDLCLLKLNRPSSHAPVKLNFVTPARTEAQVQENIAPGQKALALGYGNTAFDGQTSPVLMEATMDIVGLEGCKIAWAKQSYPDTQIKGLTDQEILNLPNVATNKTICVDTAVSDTCQGDSGGPLLNADTGVQIGITSVGIDCLSGIPAVYTSVAAFQSWITETAGLVGPAFASSSASSTANTTATTTAAKAGPSKSAAQPPSTSTSTAAPAATSKPPAVAKPTTTTTAPATTTAADPIVDLSQSDPSTSDASLEDFLAQVNAILFGQKSADAAAQPNASA